MANKGRSSGIHGGEPLTDTNWAVVAYGFALSLVASGIRFSVGPFVHAFIDDFQLTPSRLSAIVATSMLVYGFVMPLVGWLADAWSSRSVLLGGIGLLGASLVLAATTGSPYVFTGAFAILSSVGLAAMSQVALTPIISRSFVRRRGFAMMCLASGAMGGIAVMTPLASYLVGQFGWRTTYMLFAAAVLIVFVPATAWILRHERHPGRTAPGAPSPGTAVPDRGRGSEGAAPAPPSGPALPWWQAMASAPFLFLAVSFFSCGFSMNLLGTHGIPMLEHHGFDTMTASFSIGLVGFVSIFGTIALGVLADRLGRPLFLSLIYLVRGLGFLGMMTAGHDWQLFSVAAVGGLAWAGSSSLTSAITADVFGTRLVGTLFGTLFISHQIGAGLGSYMGGWAVENLDSYRLPFALAAALLFVGSFLSFQLRAHARLPHTVPVPGRSPRVTTS